MGSQENENTRQSASDTAQAADATDAHTTRIATATKIEHLGRTQATVLVVAIIALLAFILAYALIDERPHPVAAAVAIAGFAAVFAIAVRYTLSPDRLRAAQTKRMLSFASKTLVYMRGGLSSENCQAVCKLLLPETNAMAVAMTNDTLILGYAGRQAEHFPVGSPIRTEATHRALQSKQLEMFVTPADGPSKPLPADHEGASHVLSAHAAAQSATDDAQRVARHYQLTRRMRGSFSRNEAKADSLIPAGIVAPLIVRDVAVGTLKLYYESPQLIDKTQQAIAEGLADLLSTQLATSELDRQAELAAKAELQALQSQINPHFLFNTINTIASLIRTDPMRARGLLREFATFYRQTLENSNDLIPLSREIEQTERYMRFEVARFGENRVAYQTNVDEDVEEVRVPSFLIQPIVENSVNHAMRDEGTLHVTINVRCVGDDVVIEVSDDGVGMTPEQAAHLLEEAGPTSRGTGIALRNVDARLKACFDQGSGMVIDSELGRGTCVTLTLSGVMDDGD